MQRCFNLLERRLCATSEIAKIRTRDSFHSFSVHSARHNSKLAFSMCKMHHNTHTRFPEQWGRKRSVNGALASHAQSAELARTSTPKAKSAQYVSSSFGPVPIVGQEQSGCMTCRKEVKSWLDCSA